MPLKSLKNRLNQHFDLSPRYGSVKKIMPNIVYADGFNPSVGDVVKIEKAMAANAWEWWWWQKKSSLVLRPLTL